MELVNIEGTPKTPSIQMNPEKGEIVIKGRSIPENSIEFYKPVIEWLDKYATTGTTEKMVVNVQLEYFNTSSSKCILDVFKKLEGINKEKKNIVINWYYEEDDEDMLEAGEDYESIVKVPFKMIQIVD